MIKGVNKLIVDVANPDSELFERVIFFVKPQKKDTPSKELNKSADAIISGSRGTFRNGFGNMKKKRLPPAVAFAGAAGVGAAVASVLIKFVL